jgi:hypothetical protein
MHNYLIAERATFYKRSKLNKNGLQFNPKFFPGPPTLMCWIYPNKNAKKMANSTNHSTPTPATKGQLHIHPNFKMRFCFDFLLDKLNQIIKTKNKIKRGITKPRKPLDEKIMGFFI